jgi:DNA-binding winged helix-turn-helix (wHTH) protein
MRYTFGNCVLDTTSREFLRGGAQLHLSPKAYELLHLLIEQRPRVLNKAELMQALWPDTFVVEGNLPVLVAEVRSAIGPRMIAAAVIKTHHGIGYSFAVDAQASNASPRRVLSDAPALLVIGRQRFELGHGLNEVGRDMKCEVYINDPSVSRGHARITVTGAVATIIDHGSKNGTHVNGTRLEGPVELRDGDELSFGRIEARFQFGTRESNSTVSL